ncbi:GCN5-related N-acetyltransferas-like protein [Amylocarpus encephaloides]|uniref:GCN5-related N-acetyltransferas-like protein n=1 Tax=Amylocarpus encephaloides TaxID=45428 RepID=A0A9P7YRA1_9HELO|nr:GCN5-related N-acetyltransferas-like protein [Amylocarpus encephaloides]
MPVPEGTTIRQARLEDIPTILKFIQDLATYEKEPASTVEATETSLENTILFSDSPSTTTLSPTRPARALLLFTPSPSRQPAGLALYFYNYSTWRARAGIYLEDLYVPEEFRGKGYGGALLAELAKEVVNIEGGRLEWSVLKWNEPSIRFYEGESVGAERMEGWVGMRVQGEALGRLAGRGI